MIHACRGNTNTWHATQLACHTGASKQKIESCRIQEKAHRPQYSQQKPPLKPHDTEGQRRINVAHPTGHSNKRRKNMVAFQAQIARKPLSSREVDALLARDARRRHGPCMLPVPPLTTSAQRREERKGRNPLSQSTRPIPRNSRVPPECHHVKQCAFPKAPSSGPAQPPTPAAPSVVAVMPQPTAQPRKRSAKIQVRDFCFAPEAAPALEMAEFKQAQQQYLGRRKLIKVDQHGVAQTSIGDGSGGAAAPAQHAQQAPSKMYPGKRRRSKYAKQQLCCAADGEGKEQLPLQSQDLNMQGPPAVPPR